jgi:hypothetical protein
MKKTAAELKQELNATGFFCDVVDNGGWNFDVVISDIHQEDIAGLVGYLKTADQKVWGM